MFHYDNSAEVCFTTYDMWLPMYHLRHFCFKSFCNARKSPLSSIHSLGHERVMGERAVWQGAMISCWWGLSRIWRACVGVGEIVVWSFYEVPQVHSSSIFMLLWNCALSCNAVCTAEKHSPSEWGVASCSPCELPLEPPSAWQQCLWVRSWGQLPYVHTQMYMHIRTSYQSMHLLILGPFDTSDELLSSEVPVAVGMSWQHTHQSFTLLELVPGIMLCRLLMCSCVTPLSVHTLSMKRATKRTIELATSLFSKSSKPLSVSKLSATLPAML